MSEQLSRKGNKSFVELFVNGFVRTQGRRVLHKKDVQRAIALLDIKLNNPCCTDSSATTDLHTTSKGNFLITFEKLLNIINVKNNKLSLQRTKQILEHNIGVDCCEGPQGTFVES